MDGYALISDGNGRGSWEDIGLRIDVLGSGLEMDTTGGVNTLYINNINHLLDGGDLTTQSSNTLNSISDTIRVKGLQGNPVSSISPQSGQVLRWDGNEWIQAQLLEKLDRQAWGVTGSQGPTGAQGPTERQVMMVQRRV